MTLIHSGNTILSAPRWLLWVSALSLIVGCTPLMRPQPAPPVAVIPVVPPPSNFVMAASELDTWNAVGQILVRLDGVTYKGRSQKLGLYAVDYRGESFLVLTRALLASAEVHTLTTDVRVALQNGKRNSSAASIELLGLLQDRLPAELVRIAALPKPAPAKQAVAKKRTGAKKKTAKRSTNHVGVLSPSGGDCGAGAALPAATFATGTDAAFQSLVGPIAGPDGGRAGGLLPQGLTTPLKQRVWSGWNRSR
jgi:hypothetical protein